MKLVRELVMGQRQGITTARFVTGLAMSVIFAENLVIPEPISAMLAEKMPKEMQISRREQNGIHKRGSKNSVGQVNSMSLLRRHGRVLSQQKRQRISLYQTHP